MGGRHSRNKGKVWERFVANTARSIFGEKVKRGWQAREGHDAPDVDGTPWWIECKHGGSISTAHPYAALEQAADAIAMAEDTRMPIAACKIDRRNAIVAMRYEDFWAFVREWWALKQKVNAATGEPHPPPLLRAPVSDPAAHIEAHLAQHPPTSTPEE